MYIGMAGGEKSKQPEYKVKDVITINDLVLNYTLFDSGVPIEHENGQPVLTIGLLADETNHFSGSYFVSIHDPSTWEVGKNI